MALIPGGSPTLGAASSFPFPSTQPLPSSSQLQPNNKKSRKRGEPCIGAFCRRPRALRCPHGKCLSHCTTEDGGCPVHATDSADIPRPQDCDWGLDQENFADSEIHWADPSLDAGQPPQASLPSLSQQPPRLLTLSQNDDASAMPAFPIHTPSKPPRVTDQLDPLWAGDLNTRAREEIESTRDNAPVLMQWVMHCPYFPQYQLSDDPALVESLGDNILKIDVFEERFMRWIPSALTYPFTLASRCHVFVRRHGVTDCSDFDDLFKSSKLVARPTHMRFNMKGERDSLRKTNKQRQASTAASSSDIEIIDDTQLTPKPTLAPPRVIPVHIPIYNPAKPRQRWPHGMYTVDMAAGFQQMAIPKLRGFYGQEQLFRLIFGDTPFVKTTYHDNHKAWRETELTVLETHKLAGRTEDGLWANYLAARRAALGLGSKKRSGRK
ncbi:hypothetical protein P692DRAFT_20741736 [Suillus brevipes Sb2]|nr:hypothetical protein P692DRAFT_20741736 [Suillus brevipes Sb2]